MVFWMPLYPEIVVVIVRLALCAWLGLLAFTVVYGVLFGTIYTKDMLSPRPGEDTAPDRMALALATLGFAFYYTITVLRAPLDPVHPSLPDISPDVLVALLGANGVYLTSKYMLTPTGRS